ncbi:hypothetical protein E4U42_005478 [Claviceps africana]|uniref:Uncharacterized protein n=1 Tax=Claviceps africana TaxID=83212 RepID=A0A8K0JDX4_9HYPO|nr:hypothetical protein E4U42_005478 [Claviceps africana]
MSNETNETNKTNKTNKTVKGLVVWWPGVLMQEDKINADMQSGHEAPRGAKDQGCQAKLRATQPSRACTQSSAWEILSGREALLLLITAAIFHCG